MSNQDPIVIVGAARTPWARCRATFSSLAAHDLGGAAIKAAIERAGIRPTLVGEVLFGNRLMAARARRLRARPPSAGGLPKARARSRPARCAVRA